MAKLTIYVPDAEPTAYDLEGAEQVTVGRAPEVGIVIDHPSISGTHASLTLEGGQWMLEDHGSTNGTFVEGEAISKVALATGSQLVFGQVQADFEEPQAGAEPAAPADESEGYGYGGPVAEIADQSVRPSGFSDMSPIEKVEKKDTMAQIALIVGVLAIAAAIGLVVMSVLM